MRKKALFVAFLWIILFTTIFVLYLLREVSPVKDFIVWALSVWPILAAIFTFGVTASVWIIKHKSEPDLLISRERDKRLRVHFEDMQKISTNIIPTLTEYYGRIVLVVSNSHSNIVTQQIKEDTLHKLPDDFVAHFSKEAATWNSYCLGVNVHNKKYAEFELKIREFFESSGLKVIDDQTQHEAPYIYETVFHPLFVWWRDRFKHSEHPQIDFMKIDTNVPMFGTSNLVVSGWGAGAIAYAENETDRGKCKYVISRLVNNTEFEKEAANLINSANELVKSVSDLKSQLINKIQSIDKYWPGTTDYKFGGLKQCQTCKNCLDKTKPPTSHKGGFQT